MNNTGAGGVSGNSMANFDQLNFDPNKQMTPEQMQEMQAQMMRQMQMLQNNLMKMQGNTTMQQNGITVNHDKPMNPFATEASGENVKENAVFSAQQNAENEPSMAELREGVKNGEQAAITETEEDIDAPVTESPIAKEMAQFEKAAKDAAEQKNEGGEEKSEIEQFVDNAAAKAHFKRDTENYGFVKKIITRINPQKPRDSVELLDAARWKYLHEIFDREKGEGLNGTTDKAA